MDGKHRMERGKERPWRKRDWVWRSYEDARAFVQTRKLKNLKEWQAYCRSGEKPVDVPSSPKKVYKDEFITLGDWLGTGTVSAHERTYRSFPAARAFVRRLDLPNNKAWRIYCKSGQKPDDIPASPERVYKGEFQSYGDWLGTKVIAPRLRQYLPFPEARAFVQKLGLKNESEWRTYSKSADKPANIPANPQLIYGFQFRSYGDWLGTGRPARHRQYLPFLEARAIGSDPETRRYKSWLTHVLIGGLLKRQRTGIIQRRVKPDRGVKAF